MSAPPFGDFSPGEDVANLDGEGIAQEARKRLDRALEWYSEGDRRFLEDLKFAYGDSDNGYQWPNDIRNSRDIERKPSLTINIIRQHNLMIVNQMRQAKSEPKVVAMGGGASARSAQAFSWILKHIEGQSNAQAAYTRARRFQVDGGKGFWRIVTDWAPYVDGQGGGFDQEIFIRPIWDPLSVVFDPDARLADLSDARWCIIFDTVPRDEFNSAYPDLVHLVGESPLGSSGANWLPRDHIMIAEYFRKVPKEDEVVSFVFQGQRHSVRKSLIPMEVWEEIQKDPLTKTRPLIEETIKWHLIAGDRVVDSVDWPGAFIPVVRIVGEETVVDGIYDCKGHTRAMKDAQRMFNYNSSAQVEFGALQTKVPWIVPVEGIEQFMTVWETANLVNHAYLPYKSVNQENPEKPIPPPFRPEPPTSAPAFQQGMDTAFNQMMMASGQWQSQMGMLGNERTGAAISERQQQADTATFHFQDNYAEGLRYTAKILLQLIPVVYDTKRMLRIITDEGEDFELQLDPSLQEGFLEEQAASGEIVRRILNPNVGLYDVAADVGPATGTRREENLKAMTLILTQAPDLVPIIGDLLFKNMDFEDAIEVAKRLKRMVPPQALGIGPTPQEQALQAQLTSTQTALTKAMQRAGIDRSEVKNREGEGVIDQYKAETDRLKALLPLLAQGQGGEELPVLIDQIVKEAIATHLLPLINGRFVEGGEEEALPMPGARKAPDGFHYLPDPTREGGWLKILPQVEGETGGG